MTESYIRFHDSQRAGSIKTAQDRSRSIFRERHPEAEIEMMRTDLADEDESHDYHTQIRAEY